jgi:hypothetical protein
MHSTDRTTRARNKLKPEVRAQLAAKALSLAGYDVPARIWRARHGAGRQGDWAELGMASPCRRAESRSSAPTSARFSINLMNRRRPSISCLPSAASPTGCNDRRAAPPSFGCCRDHRLRRARGDARSSTGTLTSSKAISQGQSSTTSSCERKSRTLGISTMKAEMPPREPFARGRSPYLARNLRRRLR